MSANLVRNRLLTEKSSGNSIDTLEKKTSCRELGEKTNGKKWWEEKNYRTRVRAWGGVWERYKKEHRVSRAIDYNMFSKVKNLAEKWIRGFYSVDGVWISLQDNSQHKTNVKKNGKKNTSKTRVYNAHCMVCFYCYGKFIRNWKFFGFRSVNV